MFFSNIKDRSLPVLEQACERYALMVYEVFRGTVAYGFQSILYSYKNDGASKRGIFTATFIPFTGVKTDCEGTRITFVIESKSNEENEWWEFSDCKVDDLEDFSRKPIPVRFSEDGFFVIIETFDEWSYENRYIIGNGPTPHAICDKEELALKYELSDILIV